MTKTQALQTKTTAELTISSERQQFLDERKTGIGGSDAAVILGLSKYKTPLELGQEKLGFIEAFQGNRFTEAGNRLEDVIAQWYADETNSKVARDNTTFRLKDYPFIMAHIDRRVLNERKVLECKSADKWTLSQWGEAGSNEVPDSYFVQVQHYLLFPNFDNADLAALIGGNDFRIYPIEPDRELQDMMLQAEIAFWDIVSRGDLPSPICSADADRLWKRDNGSSVTASDDVIEWDHELKKAIVQQKELEAKIDDCKMKIKVFMGENQVLLGPDGKKLHTWKLQNLSSFKEKDLQEQEPAIYEACKVLSFDRKICKATYPEIYKTYQGTGRVFK